MTDIAIYQLTTPFTQKYKLQNQKESEETYDKLYLKAPTLKLQHYIAYFVNKLTNGSIKMAQQTREIENITTTTPNKEENDNVLSDKNIINNIKASQFRLWSLYEMGAGDIKEYYDTADEFLYKVVFFNKDLTNPYNTAFLDCLSIKDKSLLIFYYLASFENLFF